MLNLTRIKTVPAPAIALPGVLLRFGNLQITSQLAKGNLVTVAIDPATKNVQVGIDGAMMDFPASQVLNITYKGSTSGGDILTNDTALVMLAYGYGGSNVFTGGSSYNYVYFQGNGNTYHANGGTSDVFEDGGTGDVVDGTGTVQVYEG